MSTRKGRPQLKTHHPKIQPKARTKTRRRRWHSPFSVLGVVVGLLWIDTQLLGLITLPGPYWMIWAAPLVGVLLLAVRGVPRQLGVGLVISLVGYPMALVGLLLLAPV